MARRRRSKTRPVANSQPVAAATVAAFSGESAVARDHMARVHVDDATWAAFKQAAGPVAISELLGQLVTRHVNRDQARRLRDGSVDDRQLLNALQQARELHQDLIEIVQRLERRLDDQPSSDVSGRQETAQASVPALPLPAP